MSNEQLNKYKEETSKLILLLVNLHNKNLHFYKMAESERAGLYIRAILKEIQILTGSLRKQTKLVRSEKLVNLKEEKAKIREEKARLLEERAKKRKNKVITKKR